ncbi:MAG: hypothetical protein GXP35_14755 [Actinobacteria bacterium]|nr:hypothetical protein [Actinomycetota bacterium]
MRRLGTVLAVAAMIVATIAPAWAGGVGGSPGTIDISNALRGSTIYRTVKLVNNTGVATPFKIDFEAEAGPWMTLLDAEDRTTEISELLDEDGTGTSAIIRIDVPNEIENGTYVGVLRARLAPPDTESGTGVGLGVKIPITLDVSGDQVISGALLDVALPNTEVGVPARVTARIENSGNIQVTPELTLEILDNNGTPISKTTTATNATFPGESKIFEVTWDTSEAKPGEYVAELSVKFGGIDLGTERREFTVYPAGTLSQVITFMSLELDTEPQAGGFARFTATVGNPGQIETFATVVGELTRNGETVGLFEGLEYLVQPNETLLLPVNFEIPEEADYVFTARVRYEDSETEPISVAFSTVPVTDAIGADVPVEDPGGGIRAGATAVGVLVLVVLAAFGVWMAKRRGSGDDSVERPPDHDIDPDKQTATVGSED